MIEQVEAEIFQGFQTKGYSRPARLTCRRGGGQQIEVFVKFAGGVRNRYFGLCAEWLCSAIALDLDNFYDHVFYSEISLADVSFQRLVAVLQTMTPTVVDGFFAVLPLAWRDENALLKVKSYLNFLVDNRLTVCELIRDRIS